MSKNKKTWFNWHCPFCRKRNRVPLAFQFEIPYHYTAIWRCEGCEEESEITFFLNVNGWYKQRKPPKLKKRKQEAKKKQKEVEDDGTKKDRGYRNDHRR